jgi:hypothetical protein
MASQLKEMLAPGETVLFHACPTWREVLALVPKITVLIVVFLFIATHIVDGEDLWGNALIAMVVLLMIRWMRHPEVLLTDRRLLHKIDHPRFPLVDVAHSDIEAIDLMPGLFGLGEYLAIKVRDKAAVRVGQVPGLRAIWRVLAEQAGLPPPTDPGFKMKFAYHGSKLFCTLVAVVLVVGAGDVMHDWMALDVPTSVVDYLLYILLLIPAIPMAIVVGMILGWIVSALLIRLSFTAAQARGLATMGYVGRQAGIIEGPLKTWSVRASLGFYSWLYGRPMRCEDAD